MGEPLGPQTRKVADLIACIYKQPRTRRSLIELTGADPKTVDRWLCALADEGLIEVCDSRHEGALSGPAAQVWRWVERVAA